MTLSSLLKPSTKPSVLRATGAGVETINKLPSSKTGCLSLYISYNSIKSLNNIGQFKKLKILLMEFNEISYISDLEPLSDLKNLQVLNLEGNPVCDLPLWDFHVIKSCQKLRVLNGQKISEIPFTKSQIRHFLQLEIKFHQFLVTSKFVIRVLKLKVLNPSCEMSTATKITQKGMFSNPNFQNEYADKIRFQCTKATVDGYFGIMRRKLLNQQKKITSLSQKAHVPSKIHSFLLSQVTSFTDFDAFLETMEDIQDSILQIVGLGDGPAIEIQQIKSENLFMNMRPPNFSSMMNRNSVAYSETSSRMNQSIHSNLDNLKETSDSFIKAEQNVQHLLDEEEELNEQQKKSAINFNSNQNFPEIEVQVTINDDSDHKVTHKIEPIADNEIIEAINIAIDGNEEENQHLSETDSDSHNEITKDNKSNLSENSHHSNIPIPEIAHSDNYRQKKKIINQKANISDPPESPQKKLEAEKSKEKFKLMYNQKHRNVDLDENILEDPHQILDIKDNSNKLSDHSNNSNRPTEILSERSMNSNQLNEKLSDHLSNSNDELKEDDNSSEQLLSDDQGNEEETEHQSNHAEPFQNQISKMSFSSNTENTISDLQHQNQNEQSSKSISNLDIKKAETEEASDERLENKRNEEESNSFFEEEKHSNKINYIGNLNEQEFNLIDNVEEETLNEININEEETLNEININEEETLNEININEEETLNEINLNEEETLNEININEEELNEKHEEEDQQKKLNYIENIEDESNSMIYIRTNLDEEEIQKPNKNDDENPLNQDNQIQQQNDLNSFENNEEEDLANKNDHNENDSIEPIENSTGRHFIQNLEEDEEIEQSPQMNQNQQPIQNTFEEEEESEVPHKKRQRKSKGKTGQTFSEIDTEYAQSLSEPDGSLRASSNLAQNRHTGQLSEDQFYFEQKSIEDNENYSSASISNEPKSILKNKKQAADETERSFRASRSISFSNVTENIDQLKITSESIQFDASCGKASEFNDVRYQTHQAKMIPISYNSILRAFSIWKDKYQKRIDFQDEEFSQYIQLQDELKEIHQNIKKKKEQQQKASCRYETERGSQLREISLKQELRRKIEHQKAINLSLKRRHTQLEKEIESHNELINPREKEPSYLSNLSGFSNYPINSVAQRSTKKRKLRDHITSQYYSMLRNGQ